MQITRISRLCVGGLLLAWLLAAWANGEALNEQQQMLKKTGIDQKPGAVVPLRLAFHDEQGDLVRLSDLVPGDRPVLLNLVYYQCPMLCNMSMNGVVRSLRALSLEAGEDFEIITVSFDPREGPELAAAAKRTAIKRYGRDAAAAHWHFLTGEEDQIRQLAEAVGFRYQWDEKRGQYAHAAALMVLTPEGEVSRYLLGVEYAPRDVRLALVEAGEGQIGGISDQMLLLCFQYDPSTGKYGLLIQNVLRAAGLLTVALIGGGIGLMLYRERRKRWKEESPAPLASQPSPR